MDWISPYRLAPEDRPHLRALRTALVRDLYQRSRVPLVILLGAMGVFYAILRDLIPSALILRILFPALVAVVLARTILSVQTEWLEARLRRPAPRHTVFLAGNLLTGLIMGVITLVAYPYLDPGRFLLLCICLAGISSVTTVTLSGSPVCYAAFTLPTLGSLTVIGAVHPPFGLGYLFPATILIFMTALVVINVQVHWSLCRNVLLGQRLGDLALRDALTGLRNRRYLQEFMQEETPRVLRRWIEQDATIRSRRSISLILVDLDHFKDVNDKHGHAAGDSILVQVALLLKEIVRRPDLVLRWGGEEFLVLALDSDRTAPPLISVRVHERLAQHPFVLPNGETLRLTCSIGYAIYPFHPDRPEGLGWEQVFRMADESMYQSKHKGRNQLHGILPGDGLPGDVVEALDQPDPDFDAALSKGLIRLL